MSITVRQFDLAQVVSYNMLIGKEQLRDWMFFPGLRLIITMARETGKREHIEEITKLMLGHEIQQSASVVSSIAVILGHMIENLNIQISNECNRKLCYIIK